MVGKRRPGTKPPEMPQRSRGEEPGATSSVPAKTSANEQGISPDAAPTVTSAGSEPTPSSVTAPVTDSSPSGANALAALIEAERVELMQVFGILRCLREVLLYSDDDDATSHADVAKVCLMLIDESVRRLEVIVKRYKAGEFRAAPERPASKADTERASTVAGGTKEAAEGE